MAREKKSVILDYTTGILLGLMLFLGGSAIAHQADPGNALPTTVSQGSP